MHGLPVTNSRFLFLAISLGILSLFTFNTLQAQPLPWVLSNLHPDGTFSRLLDDGGAPVNGLLLVHVVWDVDGDGADHPSQQSFAYGYPAGDDQLVTEMQFDPAREGYPSGSVAVELTIDPAEAELPSDALLYLRVYTGTTLSPGLHYAHSSEFNAPSAENIQTDLVFSERAVRFLGNDPPSGSLDPATMTVQAGTVAFTHLQYDNETSDLAIFVDFDTVPGGEQSILIRETQPFEADIFWTPPVDYTGQIQIPVLLDDGQYRAELTWEVTVTAAGDRPGAFHLLAPEDRTTIDLGQSFQWQASQDPQGDDIHYSYIYASDTEFSDADSVTGLTEPSLILDFEGMLDGLEPVQRQQNGSSSAVSAGSVIRQEDARLGTIDTRRRSARNTRMQNEDTFIEVSAESVRKDRSAPVQFESSRQEGQRIVFDELDWEEGDSIFWKVHAYDESGFGRASEESWLTIYEENDPPGEFDLLLPDDGGVLATLSPTLIWSTSENVDYLDSIRYHLVWSIDGSGEVDTVHNLIDTMFTFDETGGWNTDAIQRFQQAVITALLQVPGGELDDLPDDVDVSWWVLAEDRFGLHTSSASERTFAITVPDAPDGFGIVFPADSTLFLEPVPVPLLWSAANDPDPGETVSYDVLASDNPELADPREFSLIAEGLEAPGIVFELPPDDDCLWRWNVRAMSGNDTTWAVQGARPWVRFAISAPGRPSPFELASPADGNTVDIPTPTLTWLPSIDTDIWDELSYTLYWSLDNWETADSLGGLVDTFYTFPAEPEVTLAAGGNEDHKRLPDGSQERVEQAFEQHVRTSYADDIDELPDSTTVHWRVRAHDTNSIGHWCVPRDGWSFDVDVEYPPTTFNLTLPDSGTVFNDSMQTFLWTQSFDPDLAGQMRYYLVISGDPDFTDSTTYEALMAPVQINVSAWTPGAHWWHVVAEDAAGRTTVSNQTWTIEIPASGMERRPENALPDEFALEDVYPNPFNPTVNVVMAIPQPSALDIRILNILGQEVVRQDRAQFEAGYQRMVFDLARQASGTYFLVIDTPDGLRFTHRLLLLK